MPQVPEKQDAAQPLHFARFDWAKQHLAALHEYHHESGTL
jgi:hypothetical protein